MERVTSCIDTFKAELATKKKAKSKETNYEIGLVGAEKGVVTRFPPEPSYVPSLVSHEKRIRI